VQLQPLLRDSLGLRLEDPAVVPDGWELQCVEGAAMPSPEGNWWNLVLQIGRNDAVFRLRRIGNGAIGEAEAGDVPVRIVRHPPPPPTPGAAPVLSGFRLAVGEPHGTLVRLPPAAGDADVRWTLQLPAHGDGLQMLVPELAGGGQALAAGWALRVTCVNGDAEHPEPADHRHEGVHELELPFAALGPGGSCVAELVLADGEMPHGCTHIISIQRATFVLVRDLPLHAYHPASR